MDRLWYRQPAERWEEALPLGNGRIGAMAHGFAGSEYFQLNEETCWYGEWRDRNNPDAQRALPVVRHLITEGRIHEAENLLLQAFSGTPQSQYPYQKLADLWIYMEHDGNGHESYMRELDISRAVYSCNYTVNGVTYKREAFISYPDDVLVVRISADKPGAVSFSSSLGRGPYELETGKTGNAPDFWDINSAALQKQCGIVCTGRLGGEKRSFAVELRAITEKGTVSIIGDSLNVKDADEAVLLLTAFTSESLRNNASGDPCVSCSSVLNQAVGFSYEELLKRHIEDYRSYYDRVELHLTNSDLEDKIPTDIRLSELTETSGDTSLDELYFNFGRYLMISGSRPGSLPLNLQGIWCRDYESAWQSKFTININTEMNYWPAESCNLSECHMPLFDHILRMVPNGRETAQKMYGCSGWVAHHNTDMWGDTAVQDHWVPGSYWVMGAAWLCTHQWTHYLYTQDIGFLRKSFPVMREAARFFLDYLIPYKGYLVTCPSVSPENTFILPSGERGSNSIGVTMDNQILRDLFSQCIKAAGILDEDDELNEKIKLALARLVPDRVGKYGQLMEWIEDYEEADPGHRHISQLYGLHPSFQITPDGTPELAKAARTTLERRLGFGGGHTGWSRAWIINNYARLFDGDEAYRNFRLLLMKSTLPNMFDNHPPFQIDGNFGGTEGIVQMLVQSSEERTILLPALPKRWPEGSVRGLKVAGGCRLDMKWKEGKLVRFGLRAENAVQINLVYEGITEKIELSGNNMEYRKTF